MENNDPTQTSALEKQAWKENGEYLEYEPLEMDSGKFKEVITIDQYSYIYVYFNSIKGTYDICRESEYMGFNPEPDWWENLSETEAESLIKENQEREVALDSVLKREEIYK